jgi:DNA-binding MarR family transcriptional regulator
MADWNLLSNHGMALVVIARDPDARMRDIAERIGTTERTAHRIVSDLCDARLLKRERHGARNRYEIHLEEPISHPLLQEHWVGELLAVLGAEDALIRPASEPSSNGNTARS